MDMGEVQSRLRTRTLGRVVTVHEQITSTRDLARQALDRSTLREGEVILAERQTAGRGTPGKAFLSETPEGVWMTLALAGAVREGVTLRAAAALVDALREDFGLAAHLKWPNDVLVGRLKIAGLLAEAGCTPAGEPWCLLSAGVNVLQSTFAGTALDGVACSVRMAGAHAMREHVLAAYLNRLEPALASTEALPALFARRSRMLGARVRVLEGSAEREVLVSGIDQTGALLVQDGARAERWVSSAQRDIRTDFSP